MDECEALMHGTEPGVPGNEKGFIVNITVCPFAPPLRITGGGLHSFTFQLNLSCF